jgi:hypothetical protein
VPAADTAPVPHPKPAAALQLLQFVAPTLENRPAAHRPAHVATPSPTRSPNEPAMQGLHDTSPAPL